MKLKFRFTTKKQKNDLSELKESSFLELKTIMLSIKFSQYVHSCLTFSEKKI